MEEEEAEGLRPEGVNCMTGGAEWGLVEVGRDAGGGGGGAIMVLVEEEEVIGSMGVGVGVREVLALAAFGVDGKLEMPCCLRR